MGEEIANRRGIKGTEKEVEISETERRNEGMTDLSKG